MRGFLLGEWLGLLAVVELRALAKVGQLMARQIVLRFSVVQVGRFMDQKREVNKFEHKNFFQ